MNEMNFNNMDQRFLQGIDIHELLPQQEPFVMVDRLTHVDEVRTVSETVIRPDNLFVEDGCFSASGLVENIAQTCAARIGFAGRYINRKGIQLGFIGAVKNLEILSLPRAGQTIVTTVDFIQEIFGTTLASATVVCEGATLVKTQITIAVREG